MPAALEATNPTTVLFSPDPTGRDFETGAPSFIQGAPEAPNKPIGLDIEGPQPSGPQPSGPQPQAAGPQPRGPPAPVTLNQAHAIPRPVMVVQGSSVGPPQPILMPEVVPVSMNMPPSYNDPYLLPTSSGFNRDSTASGNIELLPIFPPTVAAAKQAEKPRTGTPYEDMPDENQYEEIEDVVNRFERKNIRRSQDNLLEKQPQPESNYLEPSSIMETSFLGASAKASQHQTSASDIYLEPISLSSNQSHALTDFPVAPAPPVLVQPIHTTHHEPVSHQISTPQPIAIEAPVKPEPVVFALPVVAAAISRRSSGSSDFDLDEPEIQETSVDQLLPAVSLQSSIKLEGESGWCICIKIIITHCTIHSSRARGWSHSAID